MYLAAGSIRGAEGSDGKGSMGHPSVGNIIIPSQMLSGHPTYPYGSIAPSGSSSVRFAAVNKIRTPLPSPAACSKRKVDELSVARMMTGAEEDGSAVMDCPGNGHGGTGGAWSTPQDPKLLLTFDMNAARMGRIQRTCRPRYTGWKKARFGESEEHFAAVELQHNQACLDLIVAAKTSLNPRVDIRHLFTSPARSSR